MPPPPNTREMVKTYVDAEARTRVAGGADLKSSQSYPSGFGTAIELLLRRHEPRIAEFADVARRARDQQCDPGVVDPFTPLPRSCAWLRGAGMEPVLLYMRREVGRR